MVSAQFLLFIFASCSLSLAVVVFFYYYFKSKYEKNYYPRHIFEAIWEIEKEVLETLDFREATNKVVNIVLTQLGYLNFGYQVIVLTLLDNEKNELRRIAISKTAAAQAFLDATPIPFEEISVPLTATENILVKAVSEKKRLITKEVADVLYPALSREWVQKFQDQLNIKTSIVYPLLAKEKVLGALIFSLNKESNKISDFEWKILDSFVGSVGIALDNATLYSTVEETNKKLKVLDKLKDEFVSLASHELRTPMTAIKSYLWLFLQDNRATLDKKQLTYIERAYISTERLVNLVNDMLNVSRIESGKLTANKKPTNIVQLVSDAVNEFQARVNEEHKKLILRSPELEIPEANVDPDKIKQVLLNIIGNAVKYTPDGGEITVAIIKDNENLIMSVQDSGQGITKENLPKLFKKFSTFGSTTLSHGAQSTGLGLYLSKAIIDLHGGKIWAESDGEGKGSRFFFSVPIVNPIGQTTSLAS